MTFSGSLIISAVTTDPTITGADVIIAGDGSNVVFGGSGNNTIVAGSRIRYSNGRQRHATS